MQEREKPGAKEKLFSRFVNNLKLLSLFSERRYFQEFSIID